MRFARKAQTNRTLIISQLKGHALLIYNLTKGKREEKQALESRAAYQTRRIRDNLRFQTILLL